MMANAPMMTPTIVLLKQGTKARQGTGLVVENINACKAIADTLRTTLGPRGQDKLMHTSKQTYITNDGATIMDLLNISHPAASLLVDISHAQDAEVGDGTTSVVLLAGEFLEAAKEFVEEGMNPQLIVAGYRRALDLSLEFLNTKKIDLDKLGAAEKKNVILNCTETSLNSKLLASQKAKFAAIVYDAVERALKFASAKNMGVKSAGDRMRRLDRGLIGVKKISGGSIEDSFSVNGVIFKKTFTYAGFESAPKSFANPKILLLNVELELKAEKENAEVRMENVSEYQKVIDVEWSILFEKLDLCIKSGANIVLSRLSIGDIAQQYFSDHHVFSSGRVTEQDMNMLAKSTGAKILNTTDSIEQKDIGTCHSFEEKQIGNDRYNLFIQTPPSPGMEGARSSEESKEAKSADAEESKADENPGSVTTIVLRGNSIQFIDEAERSINDSLMTCYHTMNSSSVVGGCGSIEMLLSAYLRSYSRTITGKQQLIIQAYAKALEVIPFTLAANSGLDAMDVINKLRQLHNRPPSEAGTCWMGVDCLGTVSAEGVMDAVKQFVWEPIAIRVNALASATEAACSILSVDEMVKNPKSNPEPKMPGGPVEGRGRVMKHGP